MAGRGREGKGSRLWLPRVRRCGGAGGLQGGADPAHRRTALWVPDKSRARPHPQGTGLARTSPGVRVSLANHDNTNLVDGARCWPLLSWLGCGGRGRRGLLGPGLFLKRREMAISTSSGHSLPEEAAETGTDFKGTSALKPRSSALPRSQVLQVLEPPARNTPQAACVLEGLETETFLPRGMSLPRPGGQASVAPCPPDGALRCMRSVSCLWSTAHSPESTGATDTVLRGLTRGRQARRQDGAGCSEGRHGRRDSKRPSKAKRRDNHHQKPLKSSDFSASFRSDLRDYTLES